MSMTVPTTQQISDDIIAQLSATLSKDIPLLPKAFSRVLAKVMAGVFMLLWKYCEFVALQLFVAHATIEETTILGRKIRPLVEWGRLIGVGDPIAATRAELVVNVTVLNQVGEIAAGELLLRPVTGVTYQVLSTVALDAATVPVTIRAVSDQNGTGGEGAIGNLEIGDEVEFAKPQANIGRVATVLSATVTGADREATETYRARIFRRFQRKPQGGAYADYQLWGEEVPGIVNAYPYRGGNPGEVDVYVEASAESTGDPDGIPTTAQLEAVFAAIQLEEGGRATRRPVTAAINVLPITRVGFEVTISELTPETPETKAAIRLGVDEYLRSREPYIEGLSVLPREDRVTAAAVSGIVDGIVSAAGATVSTVTLVPSSAVSLGPGQKAKLAAEPEYI